MQGYTSAVHIRNKNEGLSILIKITSGSLWNWATSKALTQAKSAGWSENHLKWPPPKGVGGRRGADRGAERGAERRMRRWPQRRFRARWNFRLARNSMRWSSPDEWGFHGHFMGFYGGYNGEDFHILVCNVFMCKYNICIYIYITFALVYIYIYM